MSYEIEKKMILAVLKERLSKECVGDAERQKLEKAERMIKNKKYEDINRQSIENIKKYFGIYYPVK